MTRDIDGHVLRGAKQRLVRTKNEITVEVEKLRVLEEVLKQKLYVHAVTSLEIKVLEVERHSKKKVVKEWKEVAADEKLNKRARVTKNLVKRTTLAKLRAERAKLKDAELAKDDDDAEAELDELLAHKYVDDEAAEDEAAEEEEKEQARPRRIKKRTALALLNLVDPAGEEYKFNGTYTSKSIKVANGQPNVSLGKDWWMNGSHFAL